MPIHNMTAHASNDTAPRKRKNGNVMRLTASATSPRFLLSINLSKAPQDGQLDGMDEFIFSANALDLSGGPPYVERLCILREARPYHSVRSWELLKAPC